MQWEEISELHLKPQESLERSKSPTRIALSPGRGKTSRAGGSFKKQRNHLAVNYLDKSRHLQPKIEAKARSRTQMK